MIKFRTMAITFLGIAAASVVLATEVEAPKQEYPIRIELPEPTPMVFVNPVASGECLELIEGPNNEPEYELVDCE